MNDQQLSRADALTDEQIEDVLADAGIDFYSKGSIAGVAKDLFNGVRACVLLAAPPVSQPAATPAIVREIRRLADEHINTPKLSMELLGIANELARATSANETGAEGADIERALSETIDERDRAEEDGTRLAEAVGEFLGVDVGEWSSANNPILTAIHELQMRTDQPAMAAAAPADERADPELLPINRQWVTTKAVALVAEYRNCKTSETEEVMRRFVAYMKAALEDAEARAAASPAAEAVKLSPEKIASLFDFHSDFFTRGERFMSINGARAFTDAVLAAAPQPAQADAKAEAREPHSDDVAVDSFSAVMKHKLALARDKGRGGWETCSPADLSRMLREHVEKGDPRDVANFCMMLWHHGSPIVSAPADAGEARLTDEQIINLAKQITGWTVHGKIPQEPLGHFYAGPHHQASVDNVIRIVRAALLAPTQQPSGEVTGWQPIETAPKDGTPLVMFARYVHATASIVVVASWLESYGMWVNQSFSGSPIQQVVPSHWMPRPAFPDDAARAQGDSHE
ncbi:hypothetical protein WT25_11205 [Burkholderia territorii]|uniref:hypothetical protein n=1 Tax=Burkholderia territorii TaxID=1503055 RepID=UPI00075F0D35|nr:hypothetical protein [Burkholderia territorii]KVT86313.1 hypothetical protein WT25_11205 [Burkholderia territorii]